MLPAIYVRNVKMRRHVKNSNVKRGKSVHLSMTQQSCKRVGPVVAQTEERGNVRRMGSVPVRRRKKEEEEQQEQQKEKEQQQEQQEAKEDQKEERVE